jgi:hypothetical protein
MLLFRYIENVRPLLETKHNRRQKEKQDLQCTRQPVQVSICAFVSKKEATKKILFVRKDITDSTKE